MEMLENILGGGNQQQAQDFVQRYDQGSPWNGFSHQEAVNQYEQVAPNLPQNQFTQSATQALDQLSPEQRAQVGQYLGQQAQQQGVNVPGASMGGMDYQSSGPLAGLMGQMHQQDPGMLGQVLGGMGGGSGGENPLGKAVLGGIAAMAMKQFMGNR